MRKKLSILQWLFFSLLVLIIFYFYVDFDITIDEPLHRYYGESIVNYYLSLGRDTSFHKLFNLKYYGPFFDISATVMSKIFPDLGVYECRHLMCGLFSLIGLYYLFKIAHFWFRDFFSIVIVLIVFFSPFYFNSSFNQPKDIPFSSFFIASSYFILRISVLPLQKLKWNVYIILAIFIGITNSIRSTGVLLYIILVGLFGLRLILHRKNVEVRKKIIRIGLNIFLLSMGVTIIFFPYLHKSPFRNYIETVFIFSKFPHSTSYYYWAEKINSLETPRTYIPSFLIIKSPEYILAGLIFFPMFLFSPLQLKIKSREIKILKKIIIVFLLILILLIALKPVFYDPRQILFLYPFFYLLLLFPLRFVFKSFLWGKFFIAMLLGLGLTYSFHVIRIYHPSQSSYFNLIVSRPLQKQFMFNLNPLNTQNRLKFLADFIEKISTEKKIFYLYNREENEWRTGLKSAGMHESFLEELRKSFPFPLNLRQETITYYLPPHIQLTSQIEKADFIFGEDVLNFKNLNIEKKLSEYRGDLDFVTIYKLKK